MQIRYGVTAQCPKCHRQTRFSRVRSQRAYACQWCGWHTYPCVGTPFESSRTPLQFWFYAIYLFTTTRSGVSAKELQRQLGVTYKAAWRMGHEIRKHMSTIDKGPPLSGNVEIDESFIGGPTPRKKGKRTSGKTLLFGMVKRGGEIKVEVVPNATRQVLEPIILENIQQYSTIHSDSHL